jgi:hypothetical protein
VRPVLMRSMIRVAGVSLLAMMLPTLLALLVFAIRKPGQRFVFNRVTGPELAVGIVISYAVLGAFSLLARHRRGAPAGGPVGVSR